MQLQQGPTRAPNFRMNYGARPSAPIRLLRQFFSPPARRNPTIAHTAAQTARLPGGTAPSLPLTALPLPSAATHRRDGVDRVGGARNRRTSCCGRREEQEEVVGRATVV
jgi:hypothetical protein